MGNLEQGGCWTEGDTAVLYFSAVVPARIVDEEGELQLDFCFDRKGEDTGHSRGMMVRQIVIK